MIDFSDLGFGVVIYVGIFLGVLLVFDALWQLMTRTERAEAARNRRMRLIAKGSTTSEVLGILKPAEAAWLLTGVPLLGTLPKDLREAGLAIRPSTLIILSLAATAGIGAVLATRLHPILAISLAIFIGLGAPFVLIRAIRQSRLATLVVQLPDALDLMARGLRVGHPLNVTISTVARDMVDPIATEFGIIVDQISYGDDLVGAFRDFADRADLEDVRYLATSVAIQNGTGSDLSQILLTLSKVIRARIAMRKRILAISSEGRLTAIFMSVLPIFIFVSTSLTSPTYYSGVSDDPMFRPIAITVVVLIVANYLTMRRLVNFRI